MLCGEDGLMNSGLLLGLGIPGSVGSAKMIGLFGAVHDTEIAR
jgi:hypothetical protein